MDPSLAAKTFSRGAELSHKTTGYIPAECKIRPLRDQIILEPIDSAYSSIIIVIDESKPIRGIVRAIGPGVYPHRYDHDQKGRRTKLFWGKKFRPCDVKVGDLVSIEPFERQCFYWGDKICLVVREEDVRFIEKPAEVAA
jgi:co-chaperonin GroES (HSP10)